MYRTILANIDAVVASGGAILLSMRTKRQDVGEGVKEGQLVLSAPQAFQLMRDLNEALENVYVEAWAGACDECPQPLLAVPDPTDSVSDS